MVLDQALALIVLIFGLLGLASGAISQLAYWTGLLCAAVFSGPAAARLTPWLAPRLGWPAALVRVGSVSLLFGLIAAVSGYAVRRTLLRFTDKEKGEGSSMNRAFGFALGAGKAAAVLFAAISALLVFEKPYTEHFGSLPKGLGESLLVGFVRRHNLFDIIHLGAATKLEKVLAAAHDPSAARALEPDLKKLLADPKLKSALKDESLSRALTSGDLSTLKDDPKIDALLKDPRLADLPRPESAP